jgi:hypothetical protein
MAPLFAGTTNGGRHLGEEEKSLKATTRRVDTYIATPHID